MNLQQHIADLKMVLESPGLSSAKRLEACKLIEEANHRMNDWAIQHMKPYAKQEAFHLFTNEDGSIFRIRGFIAANQTGKTERGCAEDVAYCTGRRWWLDEDHPLYRTSRKPMKVLVVSNDFEMMRDNILPKYIGDNDHPGFIPRELRVKPIKGQHGFVERIPIKFPGGGLSEITCKTYKQEVGSFEGRQWDVVHLDEPPPRPIYMAIMRGLMKRRGKMHITMTPWNEDHPERVAWFDQEIISEGLCRFIRLDMDDNPYLDPAEVAAYKRNMTPEERDARAHGLFTHRSGVIYKTFDTNVHVIAERQILGNWERFCVVDPHDRKPWAIAWGAKDETGRIFWYDEWPNTAYENMRSSDMILDDYANLIKEREWEHGGTVDIRIMDPNYGRRRSVISDSTIEDEMGDRGLFFDTEVNDDLTLGHNRVNEFLRYNVEEEIGPGNEPGMFFMNNCRNLIHGMRQYLWEEFSAKVDKGLKLKPRDKFKDFPDLVRYRCMYEEAEYSISNSNAPRGETGYGF